MDERMGERVIRGLVVYAATIVAAAVLMKLGAIFAGGFGVTLALCFVSYVLGRTAKWRLQIIKTGEY